MSDGPLTPRRAELGNSHIQTLPKTLGQQHGSAMDTIYNYAMDNGEQMTAGKIVLN